MYNLTGTNVLACLLQEVHIPRLITPAEKGRDLEPRVMDAYIIQCQAEAQEGEVAVSVYGNRRMNHASVAIHTLTQLNFVRCRSSHIQWYLG